MKVARGTAGITKNKSRKTSALLLPTPSRYRLKSEHFHFVHTTWEAGLDIFSNNSESGSTEQIQNQRFRPGPTVVFTVKFRLLLRREVILEHYDAVIG